MSFWKTLLASILGFFVGMMLLGVFSFLMMVAIIASSSERAQVAVMRNSVLKIEPDGAIAEYFRVAGLKGLGTDNEALTLREYLSRIEAAKKDDRIDGILLKLGSYRGSWAQAQEFRRALEDFKTSGKFIYASSSSQGYNESNYFLATVADSILFNPAATMEINGIAASVSYFRPMLERMGVEAQVVRAGSFKSAVEPFILDSASAESREMMTQLVEGSFAPFREAVQTKRKISAAELDDILVNRAFITANEARDLRLVDAAVYDDEIAKLLSAKTGVTGKPRLIDIADYYSPAEDMDEDAISNQIAVVYATGTINRGESDYSPSPLFGGESIGDETFAEAMRTARDNNSVKGVVIRIDSPGGDAAASEEMWREVVLTREKKPVIVSMGATAASGGYFIAAPADTIVAEPTTLTGSIGVFGLWFTAENLLEQKVGINTQVFKTAPNADMFSIARGATDLEKAILTRNVDSTYQLFLRIVAEGRKMPVERVDSIAQGRVWTGAQAKELGLVDLLGGLEDAIDIAARSAGLREGSYTLRILPHQKDFMEVLLERLGTSAASLFTPSTPIDDYRALLEGIQQFNGVQARGMAIEIK